MVRSMRLLATIFVASAFAVTALQAVSRFSPEDEARLKATRSCPGCDLAGADLNGLVAELGDLSNANLSGANLYGANFKGANLTGASFNGADLMAAQLQNSKGADLTGATTDWRTQCPNGQPGPCS